MTHAELVRIGEQAKLDARRESLVQVNALIDAGWKFELPEIVNRKEVLHGFVAETEPWQWYWRAPAKRSGTNGKRYFSTNQAFAALRRLRRTGET